MKNLKGFSLILFVLASFTFLTTTGCEKDEVIIDEPLDSITQEETNMLKYMREEEKLARDAYLTFYDLYQLNIFKNIANAEQAHMDQTKVLLDIYGIDDPAVTEIGIFTDENLQELYNTLIAQGSESLVAALKVGATIEDVDIYDLEEYKSQTLNSDIINIFESLACGSRNHMRAFTSFLNNNGESYTPQFITQEAYEEIINNDNEQCGS